MSKKVSRMNLVAAEAPTAIPELSPSPTEGVVEDSGEKVLAEVVAPATDSVGRPLLDEVQAFLAKRVELAKRMAEEIDATEKKLVELRKTAALLQAETAPTAPKVKAPKKPRSKPTVESTPDH
ncbi:MAG: hypothetical protein QM811_29555 [Pirellulales bacterium]